MTGGRRRCQDGRATTRRGTSGVSVQASIRRKLGAALGPLRLDVVDESARHAGHAGARPGGETHFRVEIVSPRFAGLSRIARQRLVHEVLAQELKDRVHALSLKTLAPEEDGKTLAPEEDGAAPAAPVADKRRRFDGEGNASPRSETSGREP